MCVMEREIDWRRSTAKHCSGGAVVQWCSAVQYSRGGSFVHVVGKMEGGVSGSHG